MSTSRDPSATEPSPKGARLSPSLDGAADAGPAFEVKFLLEEDVARRLEGRAETLFDRDAFADPAAGGAYRTTTVYFDTPGFDVLRRSPGFRRRKYRLRRYGAAEIVFLERKSRREDRVKKLRAEVPLSRLAEALVAAEGPASWFAFETADRELRPVCCMSYRRTAFNGVAEGSGVRLTFDRDVVGVRTDSPEPRPVENAAPLLPGKVICEMKFRGAMPSVFKTLVAEFGLASTAVSKYRRLMGEAPEAAT
jgi:hypothetical protein